VIIALTGQKGGVGKSTLATSLAAELLARGGRVLLVDADPQGTSRTWGEVAAEGGHPLPTVVAMGATMHRPEQLPRVAQGYDHVVIDGPPRHGDIQRSALMVADLALLPCGPSAADAWALTSSVELLQEARSLRGGLRAYVVITRTQGRTALARSAREALKDCGLPLLGTCLGYRVAYAEALGAGLGVTTYAPRDPAAAEVRALVDELFALETLNAPAKANGQSAKAPGTRRAG
jgi:chromosome partitioning protein